MLVGHLVALAPLLAPRMPPAVAVVEAEIPTSFADYMARRGTPTDVAAPSSAPAPAGAAGQHIAQLRADGAEAIRRREELAPLVAERMKIIYLKRDGAEAFPPLVPAEPADVRLRLHTWQMTERAAKWERVERSDEREVRILEDGYLDAIRRAWAVVEFVLLESEAVDRAVPPTSDHASMRPDEVPADR